MTQLLIIGGKLSQKEVNEHDSRPFSDGNGGMFKSLLRQSGIDPNDAEFLNVFPTLPDSGPFFGGRDKAPKGIRYLKRGKYIQQQYWKHVLRVRELIAAKKPTLVLAVCDEAEAIPLWALTSEPTFKDVRGRVIPGNSALPDVKILPVISGRGLQIDPTQRPILLADLAKAKREMEFPEIRRPQHFIHIRPSLEDLEDFLNEYIEPADILSVDIETKSNAAMQKTIITCVGIAPSTDRVMVVPFFGEDAPGNNYWPDLKSEVLAWNWIKRVLAMPGKRTLGQNFQYDMQHLWRSMGIPCPTFSEDTMILHHALQPEMLKGLGFQASIYTDETPWKFMHKIKADDKSGKKEDSV